MNKTIHFILATMLAAGAFAASTSPIPGGISRPVKPAVPAAGAAKSADAAADGAKEAPALNWEQAPVNIVLQAYGDQLGKTILKDPGVPNASISLKSREGQKLSQDEYLEAIEVVLEMNGVHLEPYGEKFIRAIPRAKVRKDGVPLYMDTNFSAIPDYYKKKGKVISMMIKFENIGTEEAQKALEGFKSDMGLLQVFERTGSILITDTYQNIERMAEIARAIDRATQVTEHTFVRQIKYASASEIKTVLEAIVQDSQKELEKNKESKNSSLRPEQRASPITPRTLLGSRGKEEAKSFNNESLVTSNSDAQRGLIRGRVLIIAEERSNKLVIVTNDDNMKAFDELIPQLDIETTPDTVVKVYRLKYADAEEVSDMINDLIGNAAKSSSKGSQNANSKNGANANMGRSATTPKKSVNQRSGEAKAGELSKDNTTVLADKRINGLVVMTDKELVPTVETIIESMDVKLSQVLIETCIIEVTLGNGIATGVDWVNNNFTGKDPQVRGGGGGGTGASTLNQLIGGSTTKTYSELAQEAKNVLQGNSTYSSNLSADDIADYITAAQAYDLTASGLNPVGAGVTYFLKSDKLNISAVITASKNDSHSKYIASPIVMTVDNKEATIEATETRKFYSGSTTSSGYSNAAVSYNYTDKDLGIKIKVTPKINPNGTVMLEVEEEYSQLGAGQSVLVSSQSGAPSTETIDTALTRKMSADVLLENMQTVVLGGLTETSTIEKETGIPILKDLPWVGKWLFGSVSQTEARNELLVFMTPYVLSDGEMAQVEAARRKSALSDAKAWDDHGWSKSNLADPISVKEQLRRQKAEWKKQDEEHASEVELEKAREDRVKRLIERMKEESEEKAAKKGAGQDK